jgi:tetratricopeptide (TPR) repeat protein
MKLAVQAGLPGSEPQSWSKSTLAQLYIYTGEIDKAEQLYKEILTIRPSYAFALAGLAKVAENRKQYDKALSLLDSAASIIPEFSFHESMADIYLLKGDKEKAQKKYAQVEKMLKEDEDSGHFVALELCKLYIKMEKFDLAKKYALQEYAVRPNNIEVNKDLALIAYKQNDLEKARQYLQVAQRTNSKEPELLSRAKLIMASR